MAYERLNLKDGDNLTEKHIKHIEDGIVEPRSWDEVMVDAEDGTQNLPTYLHKMEAEIERAMSPVVVETVAEWYYTSSVREGATVDSVTYDCPNAATNTYGYAIANETGLSKIRNKPLNRIRFRLSPDETATSGTMTFAVMPIGTTDYSHYIVASFEADDIENSWVTLELEEPFEIGEGETFVIQPSDDAHTPSNIGIAILRASVATTTDEYINTYSTAPKSWANSGNYITRLGVCVDLGYVGTRIVLDDEVSKTSRRGVQNQAITNYVDEVKKVGLNNVYYGYDFTDVTEGGGAYTANFDTSKLIDGWSKGTLTANGYAPSVGFADRVTIDRYYVCDDIRTSSHIKLTALDAVVAFSSKVRTDGAGGRSVGSLVKFDFANKQMVICKKTDGTSVTSAYKTVDVSAIIDESMDYVIAVGRENSRVFASISNYNTGETIRTRVDDISTSDFSPVGRWYDYLTFAQISGSQVYWVDLYTYVPSKVKIAFLGDSITQGIYVPAVEDSYVSKLKNYYGNCVSSGRGGAKIDFMLSALDDGLVEAFEPQYVSVTIGTNGDTTVEKLQLMVEKIKALGAIPIVNCVSQTHDGKTTGDEQPITEVNAMIMSLHGLCARFDIATGTGNDPSAVASSVVLQDEVHPNTLGHELMYRRFKFDMSNLK